MAITDQLITQAMENQQATAVGFAAGFAIAYIVRWYQSRNSGFGGGNF